MSKTYKYTETVDIGKDERVIVRVEFPDPVTSAGTSIKAPDKIIRISDDDEVEFDQWNSMKDGVHISASPTNHKDDITEVKYNLYINEKLVVKHSNLKSETKLPQVDMLIYFNIV